MADVRVQCLTLVLCLICATFRLSARYNHTMLVGAGIGMTPCASILRGALKYVWAGDSRIPTDSDILISFLMLHRYKWRKGYDPKTLQFVWLVRCVRYYIVGAGMLTILTRVTRHAMVLTGTRKLHHFSGLCHYFRDFCSKCNGTKWPGPLGQTIRCRW